MKEKAMGLVPLIIAAIGLIGLAITIPLSIPEQKPAPTPYPSNSSEIINLPKHFGVSPGDDITCGKTTSGDLLSVSFHEEDGGGDFVVYKITESGKEFREFTVYHPGRLVEDRDEKGELNGNWKGEIKYTLIYRTGISFPWITKAFPKEGTIADLFDWFYSYGMKWGPCE